MMAALNNVILEGLLSQLLASYTVYLGYSGSETFPAKFKLWVFLFPLTFVSFSSTLQILHDIKQIRSPVDLETQRRDLTNRVPKGQKRMAGGLKQILILYEPQLNDNSSHKKNCITKHIFTLFKLLYGISVLLISYSLFAATSYVHVLQ